VEEELLLLARSGTGDRGERDYLCLGGTFNAPSEHISKNGEVLSNHDKSRRAEEGVTSPGGRRTERSENSLGRGGDVWRRGGIRGSEGLSRCILRARQKEIKGEDSFSPVGKELWTF